MQRSRIQVTCHAGVTAGHDHSRPGHTRPVVPLSPGSSRAGAKTSSWARRQRPAGTRVNLEPYTTYPGVIPTAEPWLLVRRGYNTVLGEKAAASGHANEP